MKGGVQEQRGWRIGHIGPGEYEHGATGQMVVETPVGIEKHLETYHMRVVLFSKETTQRRGLIPNALALVEGCVEDEGDF